MKLVRERPKQEKPNPPFPVHFYIVGMSDDGKEVLRYDLNCAMTDYGQTIELTSIGPLQLMRDLCIRLELKSI